VQKWVRNQAEYKRTELIMTKDRTVNTEKDKEWVQREWRTKKEGETNNNVQ
jgi:hypothetical protein